MIIITTISTMFISDIICCAPQFIDDPGLRNDAKLKPIQLPLSQCSSFTVTASTTCEKTTSDCCCCCSCLTTNSRPEPDVEKNHCIIIFKDIVIGVAISLGMVIFYFIVTEIHIKMMMILFLRTKEACCHTSVKSDF